VKSNNKKSSIETAVDVCKSSKYYPEGNRGLSTIQRAAMYTAWNKEVGYIDHSNKEESLEIPQLYVIFVGPSDLSQSMGKL